MNKALTSGVNEDSEDIFNTTRDKEVDPNELINNILQTVSVLPDDEQARVRAIQGIALDIRTLIGISSWYTRFVVGQWINRLKDVPQVMTAPDKYSWENVGLIGEIQSITEERLKTGLLEEAGILLDEDSLSSGNSVPQPTTLETASQN